jgi:hypothetical protein
MSSPTPERDVALLLWLFAVLIAALELVWWLFDRMYQS